MNKNLIATILVIIAVGLYFTITDGMIDDAMGVKSRNDELKKALENAERVIQIRDEVTRKFQSITKQDAANLDRMIPNGVDNIRLIIDLNNLAMQNGITLSGLKAAAVGGSGSAQPGRSAGTDGSVQSLPQAGIVMPNPTTGLAEPVLDKVSVSFSVRATLAQFKDFQRDMEANMRIMDMTHLTVSATDSDIYDFSAQYQTYWLRQ